ncbi:MAG: AAA family ATPase [Spirochaetaceae bacterium]|nr:AAA family ATPase [Spirochaetaceae bacterium]
MWIRQISVRHFAGIRSAEVSFDHGLNVLYGPNEIGKSTLVDAMRAGLLLLHGATAARDFEDWHTDQPPRVELTFETEPQRIWRVRKSFGKGADGSSYLEFSRDGKTFTQEAKGRQVDGRIRELLRWGLRPPGGKGSPKGFSESFLATTLLADQREVAAVLNRSLDDDSDESGKGQLTAALQALVQDPVFRTVVARTQERVDEAFTGTGQRSRRRGSPWINLRDQRQAADQRRTEIRRRVAESDDARTRVKKFSDELDEARSQLDNARRHHKRIDMAWDRQQARDTAGTEIAKAERERDRIQGLHDDLDKANRELSAAQEAVSAADKGMEQAAETERCARDCLETARKRLAELDSGDAQQKRTIRKQEIENLRLRNRNRRTEVERVKAEASGVRDLEAAAQRLRAELTARSREITAARSRVQQAQEQDRKDAAEISRVTVRTLALKLLASRRQLAEIDESVRRARNLRAAARAKSERAEALRASIEALSLPDSEQMETLRALQTDLRVAEETLQVGLSVEITPVRPLSLTTRADDGPPRTDDLTRPVSVEAAARLRLGLEGVGQIEIQGGRRDARQRASRLRTEWADATTGLFQRLEVDNLDEVFAKCRTGGNKLAEADSLAREAEQEYERAAAAAYEDAFITERERERERLERQLGANLGERDLEEFVRQCACGDGADTDIADAAALEDKLESIRADRERRTGRIADLGRQLSRAEGSIESSQQELDKQEAALEGKRKALNALDDLDDCWESALGRAEAELEALWEEDRNLGKELATLETGAGNEIEQARTRARERRQRLAVAESRSTRCRETVESAREARDRLTGRVDERAALVQREDLAAAHAHLEAVRARFAELPVPERGVTERDREQAGEAVRLLTEECNARQAELQKAEGALQQVGGHSVQEQLEQADEAVKAIDRREGEVEIEYGAWKLLLETLREAEAEDAVHLGKALVEPVSRRVSELTGGAYGEVSIAPTLSTESIEAAGSERDIARLSVGTRDQLATVLRLTIAEKLGSTVVLDDQLVQSDPSRMRWLYEFMVQCAREFQILVLTCHPDRYDPADGPAVRSIDLTKHIERTRS